MDYPIYIVSIGLGEFIRMERVKLCATFYHGSEFEDEYFTNLNGNSRALDKPAYRVNYANIWQNTYLLKF